MVAGLYALGHPPATIADILDGADTHLFRLTVPTRSLLSDSRLRQYLRSIAGERCIEELSMPVAIVAADLVTGREVVFRRGLLWAAALASVAIPEVFPAQVVGPNALVDGGVVNPVPSVVAAEMGADIVIAVRLRNAPALTRTDVESRPSEGAGPSVLEVISRAIKWRGFLTTG
jgi:NTE family protein